MRWLDGTVSTQSAHHIFLVQQHRARDEWNCILTPTVQPGTNILYNQHFICEQKKKSVQNFRIFTVPPIFPGVVDYKESEGQKYRVRWLDGTVSTQSAHHIFLVQQHRAHDQCIF